MRYILVLAMLPLALLCQSCAAGTAARAIPEGQDRFVRLEPREGSLRLEKRAAFEHPFKMSADEWERVLMSIQVQSRKDAFLPTLAKNPVEPAFAPDQIEFLSRGLSRTFERAHPDEVVVFGLSQIRSPQLTELTTGGWFVEGQRLHLILANYRHSVSMSHVREQLWDNPLQPDSAPSYKIVAGASQGLRQGKGVSGLLESDPPELLIDYTSLLQVSPGPSAPVVVPPPEKDRPAERGLPEKSLEERLRLLKRLKEQGLITEEEYREKKKQELDRF